MAVKVKRSSRTQQKLILSSHLAAGTYEEPEDRGEMGLYPFQRYQEHSNIFYSPTYHIREDSREGAEYREMSTLKI